MQVLSRASELMTEFLSDADFVDTLRLCQVALHRGKIDPSRVTAIRDQMAEEFPAGDNRMNHELIRLAAYLQADDVADRALDYHRTATSLKSIAPSSPCACSSCRMIGMRSNVSKS